MRAIWEIVFKVKVTVTICKWLSLKELKSNFQTRKLRLAWKGAHVGAVDPWLQAPRNPLKLALAPAFRKTNPVWVFRCLPAGRQ